ncbi:hypothetical protein [Hydrogenophaga sp.]|uniref:hypothetical protein n=1 Tax=Hydrogenophaga sp. TaxID=1904254 RepID=UPI003AF5BD9C
MKKKKQIATSLIVTPILIGATLALCLPLQIASCSAAYKLIAIAELIFPTVEKMKGAYLLGQITLVYFSTMWLLTPLTTFGWYLYIDDKKELILESCKSHKWSSAFFSGLFFPGIVLIAIFVNFESTETTDIRTFLTYHTRFGLAAMGFWIPVGSSMFLAICLFWWLHIQKIFDN